MRARLYFCNNLALRGRHLNTLQKETVLHPNQQALLDKKTGKLFVSATKAIHSVEWTNDRLYFDEVLLSDIIKELERSYDVKITVADEL